MLSRTLTKTLLRFSKFPVIGIFGPRQSGKTTLAKHTFKKHIFINFENPQLRSYAESDPQGFILEHENEHGIILDEFQYVPELLSYIQIESDEKKRPGYFVLTGSQNFLANQAVTQSLAGRIGILTLLPLSIEELTTNNLAPETSNELIFTGCYPRIYAENFTPEELYPSYIHTYVERDVRLLINVENLRTFQKFMQLCAGRVGQLLNISDLATHCGINRKTAESWLSILEASYIIFLLKPHWENFNKRATKTPKIYFYDTGLACSLLDIKSSKELANSNFRGHLFENMIISDLFKQYYNQGSQPPLYFWRDQNGTIEIDCIINLGSKLLPLEIKAGQTIMPSFFSGLSKWNELAQTNPADSYVVYGGALQQKRPEGTVIGWKDFGDFVSKR